MTRKVFVYSLIQVVWIVGSMLYLCGSIAGQRDTLAVKNKLLRRAISNQQWEITQARSRNRELDAARWMLRQTELQYPEWTQIVEKIYFYSKRFGVRPELSMSVAHRESFFISDARSNVAWGIFQINLAVWKDELKLDERNVLDLDTNIRCGIWILSQYLADCDGDELSALNKYWTGSVIPPHDGYTKRVFSSKFMGGIK
jgi:soluble lytic murein transglycosylase-like protein